MKSLFKIIFALIPALLLAAVLPPGAFAGSALLGDLDSDGAITASDARIALRTAVGFIDPTPSGISVGDLNHDGSITAADARLILRAAVKLDDLNNESVETADGIGYFYDDGLYYDLLKTLSSSVPDAPEISAEPDTFTFTVYGYGHGVGLTQYGAVAMGNAGLPYTFILSYYYSGTTLAFDGDYPETTLYVGEEINTEELVARITNMEIGGIAKEKNALKAQAVAVFTLLERNSFNVTGKSSVGIASVSYEKCSDMVKEAVNEVMGQYVVKVGDASLSPCLTVYSASCAGATVNAYDAWHGDNFPVSVSSPFDSYYSTFITTYTFTSEELKALIFAWNPDAVLSDDPAEWIEIISHNHSIDDNRGYVTEVRVGDRTLKGIGAIGSIVSLRSGCYTVEYTAGS